MFHMHFISFFKEYWPQITNFHDHQQAVHRSLKNTELKGDNMRQRCIRRVSQCHSPCDSSKDEELNRYKKYLQANQQDLMNDKKESPD